ncbi:MAG TPA: ATP-dependent helicase HrpB, partial [Methylocystis sp.]|nr:ATP-dependent helicase HrpB [Methylocystis sp.]
DAELAPLYGALQRDEQDRAVAPAPKGRRKIVLATSIAETSLTIEGVRVVIDSGLSRVPVFEPDLGLTRLETVKASRANADQRRGRAGRVEPGVCYRLWEEAATLSLPAFAPPEILAADLSGLALDLAHWGVRDPSSLAFLDPPPRSAFAEALALCRDLGALDEEGRLTPKGRAMRALPLEPRLSAMVVEAAAAGAAERAAYLAMLLSERGLGGTDADLARRMERFESDSGARARDARRLAASWARLCNVSPPKSAAPSEGALTALAFPDRIAKARGGGDFTMVNGRAASLPPEHALARESFLAVAEISGRAARARILAAAALTQEEIERLAGARIETRDETAYDAGAAALRRRRFRRLGAIRLSEQNLSVEATVENAERLARGIAALGIDRLPWTKAQLQLRDRVAFLRRAGEDDWPDLSDAALAEAAADWLAPCILGRASLSAITAEDLEAALAALLPYELTRRLDAEAPAFFETPAGSRIALDYAAPNGPLLSARVQEFFGLSRHPTLAGGRAPVTLELLSPAHRPIQTTRDLPGFWAGSWSEVKKEMKGRYPRHPWPDDPAGAAPTTRATRRA